MIRAVSWTGVGQLRLENLASIPCPEGWVLVRPDRVGLCGTDLSILDGRHSRARSWALSAVTRVRGTIVLAGLYTAPAAVDLDALTFAEQRLLGSRVYIDGIFGRPCR